MTLGTEETLFLQHLAQEWRKPASRKRWAFHWPELHALGQDRGHDAAAVERIIRQLEQVGALKDKAPDWEVMGGRFVITDRGMQVALRPQSMPALSGKRSASEQPQRGAANWLASIASWFGRPTTTPDREGGTYGHRDVSSAAPPHAAAG